VHRKSGEEEGSKNVVAIVHEAEKNCDDVFCSQKNSQASLKDMTLFYKPTKKPHAYIAGKPTFNVGMRF
jgi:hypothetical protein